MRTAIAILAVSLLAGAASAQAADFDGFYAGADVGGGILQYDVTDHLTAHDDGVTYGGFGGWRTHFANKWIAGVESRYGDTDSQISYGGLTMSSGRQWSASGLIGYQLGRKWLLFSTIGYENLKTRVTDGVTPLTNKLDGIRATFGVEYALNNQISLRLTSVGSSYEDSHYGATTFDKTGLSSGSLAALFKF